MEQQNTSLKQELHTEMEQQNTKLKKELYTKMDQKNLELKEELEKEILDHMFVFEENYGKMITIAFEELTCRNSTQENNSQQIANLERREELNTAYVQNHEDRIQKLEKIRA